MAVTILRSFPRKREFRSGVPAFAGAVGRTSIVRTTALGILAGIVLSTPALAQITGTVPGAPALKRETTVASDLVRIGDLVDNAGAAANVPVFRSPDLGQTGAVQASRVIEAIRAHGLIFVDTKGLSEVAVTRASRALTLKDIEGQIARAIAAQHGFADPKSILFTFDREARTIQLEPSATADLQVARLWYDARSGKFDITFDIPASGGTRQAASRYTGTIIETVEAAVLMRALGRGEVIKAADVATERRPKTEIGSDALGAAEKTIGLAARRPLRPGQALRPADLMKPEIVQRNEAVTLIFEVPGMMLTFRGKALESGAEGDLVNVLNIQSKRTVQGIVTGPGRVTIASLAVRPATVAAVPAPETTIVP